MEPKELQKVVEKILMRYHSAHHSFEKSGTAERPHLTLSFELSEDDALAFYENLQDANLYGFGWLMRNLLAEETAKEKELIGNMTGKFRIEFEKV
ncbi:MAG TPA: hypothetical protein VHZ04_01395 [Candidatus Paceibacterota bacterium]|jgi:hypothetical protein|nr:hypothetical protein [Candidatus Paceibacterota bacterium]